MIVGKHGVEMMPIPGNALAQRAAERRLRPLPNAGCRIRGDVGRVDRTKRRGYRPTARIERAASRGMTDVTVADRRQRGTVLDVLAIERSTRWWCCDGRNLWPPRDHRKRNSADDEEQHERGERIADEMPHAGQICRPVRFPLRCKLAPCVSCVPASVCLPSPARRRGESLLFLTTRKRG